MANGKAINEILTVGQEIKNHKKLCELLEWKYIENTNSRKAQLKELGRYVGFEKVGKKFIITEIYDSPLEKEDKRTKGNNTKYTEDFFTILQDYFNRKKTLSETKKSGDWYKIMCLCNNLYFDENYKLRNKKNLHAIKSFKYVVNDRLKNIFRGQLDILMRRGFITYQEELYYSCGEEYKLANHEEFSQYIKCKDDILNKFIEKYENINQMKDVFFKDKKQEFYYELKNLLYDNYRWSDSYTSILINCIADNAKEVNNIKFFKNQLNDKVVDSIIESIDKKHENMIEKFTQWKEEEEENTNLLCDKYWNRIMGKFNLTEEEERNIWREIKSEYGINKKKPYNPPSNYLELQHKICYDLIRIEK